MLVWSNVVQMCNILYISSSSRYEYLDALDLVSVFASNRPSFHHHTTNHFSNYCTVFFNAKLVQYL